MNVSHLLRRKARATDSHHAAGEAQLHNIWTARARQPQVKLTSDIQSKHYIQSLLHTCQKLRLQGSPTLCVLFCRLQAPLTLLKGIKCKTIANTGSESSWGLPKQRSKGFLLYAASNTASQSATDKPQSVIDLTGEHRLCNLFRLKTPIGIVCKYL